MMFIHKLGIIRSSKMKGKRRKPGGRVLYVTTWLDVLQRKEINIKVQGQIYQSVSLRWKGEHLVLIDRRGLYPECGCFALFSTLLIA